MGPVVVGVLDRQGDRLCLDPSFWQEWRPEDELGWDLSGKSICKDWLPVTPLELMFVHR
jgi:hypothetical protein